MQYKSRANAKHREQKGNISPYPSRCSLWRPLVMWAIWAPPRTHMTCSKREAQHDMRCIWDRNQVLFHLVRNAHGPTRHMTNPEGNVRSSLGAGLHPLLFLLCVGVVGGGDDFRG